MTGIKSRDSSGADLTKGRPLVVILKFMLPLFIGNIFQQLYNMVDTIIVGRFVGQNALAAVGSTGTIMFLVTGFAMGLTTGFTVLTSQKFGAGDAEGVKRSAANASLLSLIVVAAVTAASMALMHPILHIMNTPAEIYADAYDYICVICGGTAATIAYNLLSSFLRAVGNSKMPLYSLVFSAFANVGLDLLFTVTFHMGVRGAAWATVVSQALAAVVCFAYILRRERILVPLKSDWRLDRETSRLQMGVGLPMALQTAITASGAMIMQTAINLYGAVAVAAIATAVKLQNFVAQGHGAIGMAMASYAGQNYGKGDEERLRRGTRDALLFTLIYSAVAGAALLIFLEPLMSIFFPAGTDMSPMMPYAQIYIRINVGFYIAMGVINVLRNVMQGCGHALYPMIAGIVELVCRTATSVASMATHNFLLTCLCDPSAWFSAAVFLGFCYFSVMRKVRKEMEERKEMRRSG